MSKHIERIAEVLSQLQRQNLEIEPERLLIMAREIVREEKREKWNRPESKTSMNFRMPENLKWQLDTKAKESGLSKNQLVTQALEKYLGNE